MRAPAIGMTIALALLATSAAARRGAQLAFAEPADVIAAESNFSHVRAAKGISAAIRATAAANAQVVASQTMRAVEYAARPDPQLPTPPRTRQLWMSCDGSVALTHGEWQHNPASGWYVTVWQRQKNGAYKWVLAENGSPWLAVPESDMITASVADCPVRHALGTGVKVPPPPIPAKVPVTDYLSGQSDDATLQWQTIPSPDGGRSFVLRLKQNGLLREVLHAVAAPGS